MSFFSEEDFLNSSRDSKEEMRIKENAPLFSRPSSPEKKRTITLERIPEATPGPNAFAQQAARMEKHRLDGNAFYQQEVQKRVATPLTGIHPALRTRSFSDPPTPPRESSCTTMSPFINAGKDKENSPPLKLVPSTSHMAEPTQRGCIEEHREHTLHARSKSKEERTPVFVPAQKFPSVVFARPTTPHITRIEREKEDSIAELSAKTPKKSLLEKLRLTTTHRGTSSPTSSIGESVQETSLDKNVPVKAQAVLGTSPFKPRASLGSSPPKTNLPRSPSKRKGFFRRKTSDVADINASKASLTLSSSESDHPPRTSSTVTKTPPTAFSDPTHYSYQSKRIISQSNSDKGGENKKETATCSIARSQSLKYFDHGVPPTPPAKNTPPDEKAKKEAALTTKSSRLPFHDEETTPSRTPTGIVSTSERVSPTKFGSYGHRETATLITRPSVYSLHASVVPNMTEATTFEEMKARIDGLGLEGFNMPPENMRSPKTGLAYTPSMYSTDWGARPNSAFARVSPVTPHVERHSNSTSAHTKSTSSRGEIPIVYPDLAKDPSFSDITPMLGGKGKSKANVEQTREHRSAQVPWHGHTHSRDHSNSPRHSVDSTIFARHVDDDLNEIYYDSPTSFTHASATPSPLQYLPSTTYTPPRRQANKRHVQGKKVVEGAVQTHVASGGGLGIQTDSHTPYATASRRSGPFDNAPSLPAQGSTAGSRTGSPHKGFNGGAFDDVNVDPLKPSPTRSPSGDKLDKMIDMLNQLKARNNEINSMRDEMRASNASIDKRLAAVEGLRQLSSPPPSQASDNSSITGGTSRRGEQNRVPTNVAHDFYRATQNTQKDTKDEAGKDENKGSDSIAELMETNRRLLEMVGGFEKKIQALEKKVNTDCLP